ncbi:MAG: acetate--CoA ligase family protein [Pseudomonadota bacterium]
MNPRRRDLGRLLNPRSIAVIGGGAWGASVVRAAQAIGYDGSIFSVHPEGKSIGGLPALRALSEWPGIIDAAFIGVNRHATLDVVAELARLGAGGAVAFASGFAEAEDADLRARDLQAGLVAAAGEMPVLGPNCYGLINALDKVAIWPDQHGMRRVDRGVAILTQSSNIAINLTMQARGLPIAAMVTCGNQAQTTQAQIALALLKDRRITAIGLHVEGFGRLDEWAELAAAARAMGIPLIALKVGKSQAAQAAAVSHTASLAGRDAAAAAVLDRFGIARLPSLPAFLETLKLLHLGGPLASSRIASISCSGGEAALMADAAVGRALEFPRLTQAQRAGLRAVLGSKVALANPLDYHTYIWRDTEAMTRAWAAMMAPHLALTVLIVDFPRPPLADPSDWDCAIAAAIAAKARTGARVAMVATLPELMPEAVAARLMSQGVVALHGMDEAVLALEAAAWLGRTSSETGLPAPAAMPKEPVTWSERAAKSILARHGLSTPLGVSAASPDEAARRIRDFAAPVAVKAEGAAHKTETGGVALGLTTFDQVHEAARRMGANTFLVEEMITDGVAELLAGIVADPPHGYLLTLAAGGTRTELLADRTHLLLPVTAAQVDTALRRLRCAPLLEGYRGQPAADRTAIVHAVLALQDFVLANPGMIAEVEVNPLIATPSRAVAADALIRAEKEVQ